MGWKLNFGLAGLTLCAFFALKNDANAYPPTLSGSDRASRSSAVIMIHGGGNHGGAASGNAGAKQFSGRFNARTSERTTRFSRFSRQGRNRFVERRLRNRNANGNQNRFVWRRLANRPSVNCARRARGCGSNGSGGPTPTRYPPRPHHPRWPFWPSAPFPIFEPPAPPIIEQFPPREPIIGTVVTPPSGQGQGAGAQAAASPGPNVDALLRNKRYRPGEILVEVAKDSGEALRQALANDYGAVVTDAGTVALLDIRIWHLKFSPSQDLRPVLIQLFQDGRVRNAQPNYLYRAVQGATPVRSFPQKGMIASERAIPSNSSGSGVKIAIVDTCVDRDHDELQGAIDESYDAMTPGSKACEAENHGTAIAGLIGARAQLRGVASGATLLSARALETTTENPEPSGSSQSIVMAIDWAASEHAQVVNLSFAGPQDPFVQRAVVAAHKRGIVLVAAVGNAGPSSEPLYPAAYPEAIAVTAVDSGRHLYGEANRGPHICLAARGVDVLVARPHGVYDRDSGTSYAAATVSGVAALLIEKRPKATPDEIREALQQTAITLGDHGKDDLFGFGLVNAKAATTFVEEKVSP